jgi:aminopeptidase N
MSMIYRHRLSNRTGWAAATDSDYDLVRGMIGHEYFHNWTGNRVTCRDWFQLTLKEGLTVFRDQQALSL